MLVIIDMEFKHQVSKCPNNIQTQGLSTQELQILTEQLSKKNITMQEKNEIIQNLNQTMKERGIHIEYDNKDKILYVQYKFDMLIHTKAYYTYELPGYPE